MFCVYRSDDALVASLEGIGFLYPVRPEKSGFWLPVGLVRGFRMDADYTAVVDWAELMLDGVRIKRPASSVFLSRFFEYGRLAPGGIPLGFAGAVWPHGVPLSFCEEGCPCGIVTARIRLERRMDGGDRSLHEKGRWFSGAFPVGDWCPRFQSVIDGLHEAVEPKVVEPKVVEQPVAAIPREVEPLWWLRD
jgi:hypothetical protein